MEKFNLYKSFKNNYLLLFLVIGFIFSLTSCKRKVQCESSNLVLSFVGKSYWDLTDLKIYKYEKGMSTSAPIDSMTFTNGTGLSFQSDNDAINMFITYAFLRISSPYDYKLKFNSTTIEGGQNELLITEITDKAESIKCKATFTGTKGPCSCMNELTSYKINGVTRTLNSSVEFDGIKGYKIRINP
jgi:hypothetical protein